jgi:D-sedoheptulose 7-phosphate isomerase
LSQKAHLQHLVQARIKESLSVKEALLQDAELIDAIIEVARKISIALRAGRRLFLFGNGGSAADAQHIAAEFVARYKAERRGLPAIALTVNASSLTAIGNDYGFELVYARQLEALGAPGDVAIGISTSGNSANVITAIEAAKKADLLTVGLSGRAGRLGEIADLCLRVPSDDTPRIQECHILMGHLIAEIVENELFPS